MLNSILLNELIGPVLFFIIIILVMEKKSIVILPIGSVTNVTLSYIDEIK